MKLTEVTLGLLLSQPNQPYRVVCEDHGEEEFLGKEQDKNVGDQYQLKEGGRDGYEQMQQHGFRIC